MRGCDRSDEEQQRRGQRGWDPMTMHGGLGYKESAIVAIFFGWTGERRVISFLEAVGIKR